jgi:hypothetical protein
MECPYAKTDKQKYSRCINDERQFCETMSGRI